MNNKTDALENFLADVDETTMEEMKRELD